MIFTPLCKHDIGTAPLVHCWTCGARRLDEPWNTTGRNPSYAIRPCRGAHWHVICCGNDLVLWDHPGDVGIDAYSTIEKAQAIADLLNSRPTEPQDQKVS